MVGNADAREREDRGEERTASGTTRTVTNAHAVATAIAMTRAFQGRSRSARIATIPPAPTPATNPVTASAASAEIGMPTASVSSIAFTDAAAGRGCADANASRMNTKGTSMSPNAIQAPALRTPPEASEATETTPASRAQYAGTRSSVARRMARHLRRGASGHDPAGTVRCALARPISPSPNRP